MLASVGVAAGIVLVIVVARVLTGQVGFTESDLTKRIAEQERRVSGLELSVARLQAPQRIYDRAIKLGLVPADRVVFLAQTPVPAVAKAAKAGPARPSPARPSTSPGRGGR